VFWAKVQTQIRSSIGAGNRNFIALSCLAKVQQLLLVKELIFGPSRSWPW
jgi:hypothetical protein